MDKADIREYRGWHRRAALKAREVGFDIVYVYAADDLELLCDVLGVRDDLPYEPRPLSGARIALCRTPVWSQATRIVVQKDRNRNDDSSQYPVVIPDLAQVSAHRRIG